MTDKAKGYVAALLYALIIGLSFMFVKLALTESSALDLLGHRYSVAFLCAIIPVLIGKVRLNISRQDVVALLPVAILFPFLFFLLQTLGLELIPSLEAGIIQAMIPIFTIIFAIIILGERINGKQVFFVLLSVSGVIFISIMKGASMDGFNVLGSVLFLVSTIACGLYSVFARRFVQRYPLYEFTFITTAVGFVAFNVGAIGQHLFLGTFSLANYFAPFSSWLFVGAVVYLGAPSSFGTAFLINYALSKLEASIIGIFMNLTVVIMIFAGAFFLNEALYWYHVVGAVAIIVGVLGVNKFITPKKENVVEQIKIGEICKEEKEPNVAVAYSKQQG